MLVRDIMTPEPIVLAWHDSVDLAEKFMDFAHVRHLPVVSDGELVGLVTHRDLLLALEQLLSTARDSGANVELEVAHLNPAKALYARMGFTMQRTRGAYAYMHWSADSAKASAHAPLSPRSAHAALAQT